MYIIITNDSKVRVIGMAHARADDTIFLWTAGNQKGRIREGGKKILIDEDRSCYI